MAESRIPYAEMVQRFALVLKAAGMLENRAIRCAELFANASRDGVPSHGLNRFTPFLKHLKEGIIAPNAIPTKTSGDSALEQWNGQHGPGTLNAEFAMHRACQLAKTHGIGCVALSRTNHWMRAGNYGWQAANTGCIGICWTNATPTMAPWGGKKRAIGNNPLVIAVPRTNQKHIVLDMAQSQFSFGKLGVYERAGQQAPLPAGFTAAGEITTDPGQILRGGSALPIGYWKGSGLAIMLDLIASVMANGKATWQVAQGRADQGVSQMFFALQPGPNTELIVEDILKSVKAEGDHILYPGERALATREESMQKGVLVDSELWNEVLTL